VQENISAKSASATQQMTPASVRVGFLLTDQSLDFLLIFIACSSVIPPNEYETATCVTGSPTMVGSPAGLARMMWKIFLLINLFQVAQHQEQANMFLKSVNLEVLLSTQCFQVCLRRRLFIFFKHVQ
jgi:hypothetical protein